LEDLEMIRRNILAGWAGWVLSQISVVLLVPWDLRATEAKPQVPEPIADFQV
jgi:hypothetical protein